MNENIKVKRLNEAHLNYNKIIFMGIPYKFEYLADWELKRSKLLLREANSFDKELKGIYKIYKRGTIINVDFGVGLGSEMSKIHYAIVLNKFDSQNNNILTVIPLTSKKGKFNLDLDYLIFDVLNSGEMKHTYACCSLITTISKTRIIPISGEYKKMRCSAEIMNKIDIAITNCFIK